MLHLKNYYELVDIMTDLDEDTYSINYVGHTEDIYQLLKVINECTNITPDFIEFDSEGDEGETYVFSIDRDNSEITYSIMKAINPRDKKFYGINGEILVASDITDSFEEEIENRPCLVDFITRVKIGEPENKCDNIIFTNKSENGITQSWTDGNSYFSRSYYSSDVKDLESIAQEWNDFAKRLNNKG